MAERKNINNTQANSLCEKMSFAGREAYKRLRTNVLFSFADSSSCHIVGVTSAQPSDGKSTTSVNLAYSMAQLEKKVLLIDADMRKSSVDKKLSLPQKPGLSNLLTDVNNVGSAIREYTPADNSKPFYVMTAGDVPPNPSELLNSERMSRLLESLSAAYDFIVIDLPPVGAVVDAQTLARKVSGMLVVIREGHADKFVVDSCINELKLSNAKILGFVVNGSVAGSAKSGGYGKYGKSGYGSYGYYK